MRGVAMKVVASAMQTIIENSAGARMPLSAPTGTGKRHVISDATVDLTSWIHQCYENDPFSFVDILPNDNRQLYNFALADHYLQSLPNY